MHGKSVTLFLDCQKVATVDLPRGDDAEVSTEGVTVFGRRLLDQAVFEVGPGPSGESPRSLLPILCRRRLKLQHQRTKPREGHKLASATCM